jgi:hypothetical protein
MSDGEIGMSDIHSCSYFCICPACVLRQRDELRGKLLVQAEPVDKALTKPAPQVDKEQAEPHKQGTAADNDQFMGGNPSY